MTVDDIFKITMAAADEMTDVINVVNPTDTASYKARTPSIVNMLQAELIKVGDLFKSFEYSQKPLSPLGGGYSGFDYLSFTGVDILKEWNGSAKAYYFELDGEATVTIEDFNGAWNTIATINCTDTSTRYYTAYKGVLTPSSGANKTRFRFSGTYEYTITNYALFKEAMKANRIPTYRPFFKVVMPTDFKSIDQIISEYPIRQYGKDIYYKWENRNELWVNYFFEGNIRINYRPIPTMITAMTDVLEIDDVTARTTLVYGVGAELFKEENDALYRHFSKRYNELKALSMVKDKASEEMITDIYGWR